MGRRPYSTQCKFFRDNTEVISTIKWIPADPAAGTLGMPSKINSLDWSTHPWLADGVGEVYGVPRPYNGAQVNPLLDGGHVCGTPQDFAEGGLYQPDLPPVQYDDSGVCLCCRDLAIGVGGAIGGGLVTPTWVPPPPPPPPPPMCLPAIALTPAPNQASLPFDTPLTRGDGYITLLAAHAVGWVSYQVPLIQQVDVKFGAYAPSGSTCQVYDWDGGATFTPIGAPITPGTSQTVTPASRTNIFIALSFQDTASADTAYWWEIDNS